jgi:LysM repeat protein
MPEVPKVDSNFLMTKIGPVQVWVWGAGGLGVAYLYAKHKSSAAKSTTATTATTATSTTAGEPAGSPPQFVIENNLPGVASAPHGPAGPVSSPPTVTPPGTSPTPPVTTGPVITPVTGGTPPAPVSYTVVSGDTLSSIAARYGTTAGALYAYNTTPGNRPAATIATLKQRGPNLIYAGETILVPQS